MRLLQTYLLVTLSTTGFTQTQFNVVAGDGFELNAQIREQENTSHAILLLHQCDADQNMYQNLSRMLFEKGFHVISFDYRGLGKSISESFDIGKASNKSEAWSQVSLYNERDLDTVWQFIERELQPASISILGASCGGDKVMYLLSRYRNGIAAFGFLSTRLSEESVQRLDLTADIPTLFIAAREDKRAYEVGKIAEKNWQSPKSKFMRYEGNYHAKSLFELDPTLERKISEWFAEAIR